MGPILPFGFDRPGWFDRPGAIGDPNATGPGGNIGHINATLTASTQTTNQVSMNTVSALGVNNSVSQLLKGIGGGLENNKMLEMMIALMILMAMLEQQTKGGGGAAGAALDILAQLGGGGGSRGVQYSSSSYSSTSISLQYASLSFTSSAQETFRAISQPGNADGASGQRVDVQA